MSDLQLLRDALDGIAAPNFAVEQQIERVLEPERDAQRLAWDRLNKGAPPTPNYTSSLDAALALRDTLLPDREVAVWDDKENGRWAAKVGDDHWDEAMNDFVSSGPNAAIALMRAIIQALCADELGSMKAPPDA
ncbi:MAG TPA: hypothetical protein VEA80_06760 [Vitreimonas sp.]|uniref:hypothetical protein n=1 Tax=Vitreimonas sp. TaxID=3069702 RepID=UPI002D6CDC60|nr:hypothetical protein [Vitreimonas sp.]HYD87155.1 hypothetical protein [Vitreimonas sp.]